MFDYHVIVVFVDLVRVFTICGGQDDNVYTLQFN